MQHEIFISGGVFMKSLLNEHITFPEKHLLEVTAEAVSAAVTRDVSCLISGYLIIEDLL